MQRIAKFHKVSQEQFLSGMLDSFTEYTEADIQQTGSWHRIGIEESEYVGYEYICCPVCKNTNIIRDIKRYF